MNDLIIIGSGPAGLTAAIYASRANLKPILLAGEQWGGQLMNTTDVENFPGFPQGINGAELMNRMMEQAKKFGTNIKYENAISLESVDGGKLVKTSENEYKAKSVILTVGSKARSLGIPGEDKFWGKGVSTCATCDGAFYKDKVVAVVGGGDSAMEESTFLTRFAKKVYLIHRRGEFRASKIMQERALNNEKIEVLWNTEVKEVLGENNVTGMKIYNNKDDEDKEIAIDGFFLAIGHDPATKFLNDFVEMDEKGYLVVNDEMMTSIEGVFAAGEAIDYTYKQAITTAGDGCKALLQAQKWIEGNDEIKGTW